MRPILRTSLPLLLLAAAACSGKIEDKWEKSPGVLVTPLREVELGKPYMTVLYENFGQDTVEKIKYQLITETRGKLDTTERIITPPKLLRPKDRHSVPRHIGEDTISWDAAHVGEVWVVKKK